MTTIRMATPRDADSCIEIYRPIVAETVISFETEVPARSDFAARISSTLDAYPWLVADGETGVCGYAYACAHRQRRAYQWSVEVSAYVRETERRAGHARRLYACLFDILRAQGFVNAYAGITLPNPASVALHESLGFQAVGVYRGIGYKFDAWHDVGWWGLRLSSPPAPAQPRALADLADNAAGIIKRHHEGPADRRLKDSDG